MTVNDVLNELKALSSEDYFMRMNRFGIHFNEAYGVKVPDIRKLAKRVGKNHPLAMELRKTNVHEAQAMAPMIADYKLISESDFDDWVNDFKSWDICDGTCNLLGKTSFARDKIDEYADNQSEFAKRTAFVLMCYFAVHEKMKPDDYFYPFFDLIEREASDNRNLVRKAVNWALRQIGKRNVHLRMKAIETAEKILLQNTASARWIARDALRELRNIP